MRIVAGTAKGRALLGPKNKKGIRPTADRVRESLFNILGQWMEGLRVLDLYAGTGALGLEALSRGAASLLMVDKDRDAISLCGQNAKALGFGDRCQIWNLPADRALAQLGKAGQQFDLIFADPPYAARVVEDLLEQVEASRTLGEGGRLVVEHDRREGAPERQGGMVRLDQRRFGDTQVSVYGHSVP